MCPQASSQVKYCIVSFLLLRFLVCSLIFPFRYKNQINHLEDASVKLLGECGVRRMLVNARIFNTILLMNAT